LTQTAVALEEKYDIEIPHDVYDAIDELSVQSYKCEKYGRINGVNSVSDLVGFSQEDLLEIKNFGAKSAEEVIEALQTHLGITLPLEKASKSSS
jgi:DNA-directed RNA polymerase subunit alpha